MLPIIWNVNSMICISLSLHYIEVQTLEKLLIYMYFSNIALEKKTCIAHVVWNLPMLFLNWFFLQIWNWYSLKPIYSSRSLHSCSLEPICSLFIKWTGILVTGNGSLLPSRSLSSRSSNQSLTVYSNLLFYISKYVLFLKSLLF